MTDTGPPHARDDTAPSPSIAYHLGELEAACDPSDPYHSLPNFGDARRVLDVGCGIGQVLLGATHEAGTLRVGVDIDEEALAYGSRRSPEIALAAASVERLPFADGSFDMVSSRVSLPYTALPLALDEIARVLAPGGRLWVTLHPLAFTRRQWLDALRGRRPKDLLFRSYVLLNGAWLHATGRVFAFPGIGRTESFQTETGMRRLLARRGFDSIDAGRTGSGSLRISARKELARGVEPLSRAPCPTGS